MTLKQYQLVKIGFVIVMAAVISQAVVYKNYMIPIAVMAAGALALLYLRGKVKEVIADERDYAVGGKAALLAMQIYSWIAVVAMFILYGSRDLNPFYEPIGSVLAFSACTLMLLYSVIFRYYNKVKFTDKKLWFTIAALVLFVILAVASLRLFSGEDDWICQNGEWVKHGNPSFPAPAAECK